MHTIDHTESKVHNRGAATVTYLLARFVPLLNGHIPCQLHRIESNQSSGERLLQVTERHTPSDLLKSKVSICIPPMSNTAYKDLFSFYN